jgi:hypothetical protein
MGADIYIVERMERSDVAEFKEKFYEYVNLRNNSIEGSDQYKQYDSLVKDTYDHMYPEDGYFRDSYNESSLFWMLDLSWWQDVGSLIDEMNPVIIDTEEDYSRKNNDYDLDFIGIQKLLDMVVNANWHSEFDSLSEVDKNYFIQKREKFINFCQNAINNKWHMTCSI